MYVQSLRIGIIRAFSESARRHLRAATQHRQNDSDLRLKLKVLD